jgi:hypothetical protein
MFFFRAIWERLSALGSEQTFKIENNKSSATDVTVLKFDSRGISQAVIEYLIQRITTGDDAVELLESGILIAVYKPTSDSWALVEVDVDHPSDSGVTFSITSSGQIQYTSSDVAGTPEISRLVYRVRTLAGKHNSYSQVGAR